MECERAGFGPVLSSPATVKKSATENSELNKKQSYKHVGRYSGSFSPPGRVWGYFTSRMEDLEKKKIQNQYFITWLATLKIFHQFPHTLVLHELWPLSYDQENKRFASFLEGIFLDFLFLVMINFQRFISSKLWKIWELTVDMTQYIVLQERQTWGWSTTSPQSRSWRRTQVELLGEDHGLPGIWGLAWRGGSCVILLFSLIIITQGQIIYSTADKEGSPCPSDQTQIWFSDTGRTEEQADSAQVSLTDGLIISHCYFPVIYKPTASWTPARQFSSLLLNLSEVLFPGERRS